MAMPLRAPLYTVAQVKALPQNGVRFELLDGMLLVTATPSNLHQVVLSLLYGQLHQALMPARRAWVVSPGELEIGDRLLLDPDILVYPASYAPGTPWPEIRGWWLAVEVLSRSTQAQDRRFKRPALLKLGVEQVWLVNPKTRTIEVWTEDGCEVVSNRPLRWQPKALGGETIEIDLDRVFPKA